MYIKCRRVAEFWGNLLESTKQLLSGLPWYPSHWFRNVTNLQQNILHQTPDTSILGITFDHLKSSRVKVFYLISQNKSLKKRRSTWLKPKPAEWSLHIISVGFEALWRITSVSRQLLSTFLQRSSKHHHHHCSAHNGSCRIQWNENCFGFI